MSNCESQRLTVRRVIVSMPGHDARHPGSNAADWKALIISWCDAPPHHCSCAKDKVRSSSCRGSGSKPSAQCLCHACPSCFSHLCLSRLAGVAGLASSLNNARQRSFILFEHSLTGGCNVADIVREERDTSFLPVCSHNRICTQFDAAKRS